MAPLPSPAAGRCSKSSAHRDSCRAVLLIFGSTRRESALPIADRGSLTEITLLNHLSIVSRSEGRSFSKLAHRRRRLTRPNASESGFNPLVRAASALSAGGVIFIILRPSSRPSSFDLPPQVLIGMHLISALTSAPIELEGEDLLRSGDNAFVCLLTLPEFASSSSLVLLLSRSECK